MVNGTQMLSVFQYSKGGPILLSWSKGVSCVACTPVHDLYQSAFVRVLQRDDLIIVLRKLECYGSKDLVFRGVFYDPVPEPLLPQLRLFKLKTEIPFMW